MMSRWSRALLVSLTLPAALAAQNPVTLRVQLRQGQTAKYRSEIQTWVGASGVRVDTTQPARVLTLYSTRTVMEVRGDTAVIKDQIDSARVTTPGIPGVDTAVLHRAADHLKGVVTLSAVNGRGHLLDYAAGTVRQDNVDPALQAVLPMGGLLRVIFGLPASPVKIGDSWTEHAADGARGAGLNMTARYTLASIASNIASITAAGEMGGGGGAGGSVSARFDGTLDYDMRDSQPTRFDINMVGTVSGPDGLLPLRVRRTTVRL